MFRGSADNRRSSRTVRKQNNKKLEKNVLKDNLMPFCVCIELIIPRRCIYKITARTAATNACSEGSVRLREDTRWRSHSMPKHINNSVANVVKMKNLYGSRKRHQNTKMVRQGRKICRIDSWNALRDKFNIYSLFFFVFVVSALGHSK